MSCDDCRQAQQTDEVIFYRLDNANLAIQCCPKHFRMLRARLQGQSKPTAVERSVLFLRSDFLMGVLMGAGVTILVVALMLWSL